MSDGRLRARAPSASPRPSGPRVRAQRPADPGRRFRNLFNVRFFIARFSINHQTYARNPTYSTHSTLAHPGTRGDVRRDSTLETRERAVTGDTTVTHAGDAARWPMRTVWRGGPLKYTLHRLHSVRASSMRYSKSMLKSVCVASVPVRRPTDCTIESSHRTRSTSAHVVVSSSPIARSFCSR